MHLGAVAAASPQSRTDVPHIAYQVLGSGKPVIVMLSGLGADMTTFAQVAPEIATSATVIVYDRAGYGDSDLAAGPKDAASAERELSSLLARTGIPGPYVLAGHSLGGLFAEYYAAKHPEQVAGLILEESRPADFARRCEAASLSFCTPLPGMMKNAPQGAREEVLALPATESQVRDAGPVSGKPVLILSRPTSADATTFAGQWSAAQVELAKRYPRSVHLLAEGGGHDIHRDQRAWYVESVQAFLRGLP
jgi:pimeloyl-ACP methyl ester carboxylesterase